MLVLACQLLDMNVAYLTRLDRSRSQAPEVDAVRTIVAAVTRDGHEVAGAVGLTEPLANSWCGPVLAQGSALVPDVEKHPELAALASTATFRIASHAGVAVPGVLDSSRPIGTLCVLGHSPHPSLNSRDAELLRDIATVLAPLLATIGTHNLDEQPEPDLPKYAATLLAADGLQGLTRPILETLHELTRLSSTYLTVIHEDTGQQEVRYAMNTKDAFTIPEGIQVPWADTLCRRALSEGRVRTTDVPEIWGDSDAATALGIQVYVSVPVELPDGRVWGTLCAADSEHVDGDVDIDTHLPTMRLFSRLIAAEVERSTELSRSVQSVAERAMLLADTDPLTGCLQRRLIGPWLLDALATAPPEHELVVAFIDVDDFKTVNDRHGHTAGDTVLVEVARRLRRGIRPGDLLARYGGDEFLAAAILPPETMPDVARRLQDLERLTITVDGSEQLVRLSIGIASQQHILAATTNDVTHLIQRADQAMYAAKRSRRPRPQPDGR